MKKRVVQINEMTKVITLYHEHRLPEMYMEVEDVHVPIPENKIAGLRNMFNEAYDWYQSSLEISYGN